MRLFASVYYKGTNYFGWQRQPNVITVQEVIEDKLSQYFNREITIYGAGRTDAGVHAFGQKFHFDIDVDEVDLDRLIYSINQMLPNDIKIDDIKDPFLYETTFLHPNKINIDKLRETLTHFVGVHNFKNFTSKEEDKDNFIREIYSIEVNENNGLIYIILKGNGFMRYMVRLIVGMSIRIVDKDLSPLIIDELLDDNAPRNVVAFKAPPQGLTLVDVEY